MTTPPPADWERRFDKADLTIEEECDPTIGDGGTHLVMDEEKVKSFIHSEITAAVEAKVEEIIKLLEENRDFMKRIKTVSVKEKDPVRVANQVKKHELDMFVEFMKQSLTTLQKEEHE